MDEYIGTVKLFAFQYVPDAWLPCDGRLIPLSDGPMDERDAALFSLLGSQYGGDGMANFALPNLPPVVPADGPPLHYCICTWGLFPQRA